MKALTIAMFCHGINAAYCASLGDTSQPTWDDAPEWQKNSALAGVEMHLANPNASPEDSHNAWLKQKTEEGWKYGAEKNAELKEHPCFLPYEELPQAQKSKDYLFKAVVHLVKDLPEPSDHNALLTELVSAQTQLKAFKATLAAGTTAAPQVQQAAQGVTLVYESFRSEHTDTLYGSGVTFISGKPKAVPKWLADKLLKHPEFKVYEAAQAIEQQNIISEKNEVSTASTVEQVNKPSEETLETIEKAQQEQKEKDEEEDSIFDAKQTVAQINDKDLLAEYAMKTFNQKIPKNQSIDWMKGKINELIDQQGLPS